MQTLNLVCLVKQLIFSRTIFRSTSSNVDEGELVVDLVEPQMQNKNQSLLGTQASVHKGKSVNDNAKEAPAKYMIFQQKDKSYTTNWDLPSRLVFYWHKYMSMHVLKKDINDKIFSQYSVSQNIKISQKLDEFIKQLLLESRKSGIFKKS